MSKTRYLFCFIIFFIVPASLSQTHISPGNVSGTWSYMNSPYLIEGDITVPDDSILIIEPGVFIEFQGHYALYVQGQVLASGTTNDSITFTVYDTTGFHNSDTVIGGWYGIRFIETPEDNDTSRFTYCNIKYGKAAGPDWFMNAGGAFCVINFDKIIISNCTITNCSAGGSGFAVGGAIAAGWSDIIFINNTISNNKADAGGAIHFYESDPVLLNNRIEGNSAADGGAIDIQTKSQPLFTGNQIINNSATGNGGAVVIGGDSVVAIFNECDLSGNSAYNGGAINSFQCELTLNECSLTDNASGWIGGAINASNSKIEILNTSFERDTAFLFGGAMGIYNSDLIIENSDLNDNSARILGGAIHSDFSTISISNTDFEKDTSGNAGGGIFIWQCQLALKNCTFNENSAVNSGGAIFSDSSSVFIGNSILNLNKGPKGGAVYCQFSDLLFNNNSFSLNSAGWGGGISSLNCDILVDSCDFYQNSATDECGAIEYTADTINYTNPFTLQLINSEFIDNSSENNFAGVRIVQRNSDNSLLNILIDKCLFKGNTANTGAALRITGFIDNVLISNSVFDANSSAVASVFTLNSGAGGKIQNCIFAKNNPIAATIAQNSAADFINCTFVNNFGPGSSGLNVRAGGIASLTNCIFWGQSNKSIALITAASSGCSLYTNYCNIEYGMDSISVSDTLSVVISGSGNINSDPLFADTSAGNYRLMNTSPCLGAGIDSVNTAGFWIHSPLTDIEGNPRPYPAGTMPDMGAYESQYPSGTEEFISELKEFILFQNYPNPFNPITVISYRIPVSGHVAVNIYDIIGNEIASLVNENMEAGTHEVTWNAGNFSSGIYFYEIRSGSYVSAKKMILLK